MKYVLRQMTLRVSLRRSRGILRGISPSIDAIVCFCKVSSANRPLLASGVPQTLDSSSQICQCGSSDTVDRDDKFYYRNVHAFTNRLRVAAQSRDVIKISQNLDTCFRGEAERWWNSKISDVIRRRLIHSNSIDDWCRELEKRFQLHLRYSNSSDGIWKPWRYAIDPS